MKPDLHCHSHFSDGGHSLSYLIKRAVANNVTHLAITDHDCIAAHRQPLPDLEGLTLVPGVEISCNWGEQEIHLVGLGIDTNNVDLTLALEQQQLKRRKRIAAMANTLKQNHDCDLLVYLETLACISVTRTHVADFLVESKLAKNHVQAFKKFLSRKGKLYEPIQWMALAEAIKLIQAAGGLCVIAHPSRYRFTRTKLIKLLEEFKQLGGDALEASYSNLDPQSRAQLVDLSEKVGLYISCGSDFHSEKNHWMDIGKFPTFAADTKNAIWNHPKWHLQ